MDADIEAQIQAKGLSAPRVTPTLVEDEIASEFYFRPYASGLDALRFQFITDDHPDPEVRARVRSLHERMGSMSASAVRQDVDSLMAVPGQFVDSLKTLTLCVLVLHNGFTVTGESACASPENFNAEIGRTIARRKAVGKLQDLLGFRLRDRLSGK